MWEDDDSNEDSRFDPEEHRRKVEALPIYQKAEEIRELTEHIIGILNRDSPHIEVHSSSMLDDALEIPAKIAAAEAVNDYILKMENATIIKIRARSLLTQTSSLRYMKLAEPQYLELLRMEIDAFRLLFKEWVKGFENGTTREGDGWGLFLPDK